jgi:S-adenosylmethionine hydrolase
VHLAVVDPGVGGARRAIAVETADYLFVGPDNGVLSFALAREKIRSVRRIENEKLLLRPLSRTFHGRDVFAPVAAYLSRGLSFQKLGSILKDFVRLPWPEPKRTRDGIEGQIVYLDRFGNAITNIPNSKLRLRNDEAVFAGRKRLGPVKAFYQAVPGGRAVAVPGSSGLLEIAVNGGSAAKRFGFEIGDRVRLRHK